MIRRTLWSEKEIKKLKKLFSSYKDRELTMFINRPTSGIQGKARDLGLKKSSRKVKKICKVCKKEFFLYPCQVKGRKNHGLTCSVECNSKLMDTRIKVKCDICGKEFLRQKRQIKKRNYCGQKCCGLAQRKRKKFKCIVCGKVKERPISQLKGGGRGKFCGKKCRFRFQRSRKGRALQRKVTIASFPIKSPTDIELILQKILDGLNIKHISQVKKFKRYILDEIIPKYALIVEAQGTFWHQRPKRKRRDRKRKRYLEKRGYKVLLLDGQLLKKFPEKAKKKIIKELDNVYIK